MNLTAEQVLDGCVDATVLTVDFFDTLITRSVAQPTHVFAVMEQQLVSTHGETWRGFAVARVEAEQAARTYAFEEDENRDVTLEEIVLQLAHHLSLDIGDRAMLIELEKKTEISLVQAVPFGIAITKGAQERGMKVAIVSDNYMPSTHLVAMAHAAGYMWVTIDDVFVSSEHGGMKHNGALWPVVLSSLDVDAAQVLHVGDDAHADGEMPQTFGIATHVHNTMRASHRTMINTTPAVLPLSRIEAWYRDKMDTTGWDVAEVIGGGLVAMVVASQILDVQSVLANRHVAGVHFAARDGFLAHQVWNKLRDRGHTLPEASYTAFSRSVVWRASLNELTHENVGRFVGDDEVLTVERLSRRVGTDLLAVEDETISLSASRAREIVLANASEVMSSCVDLHTRLQKYIRNQGVLTPGHHLVVDLGWTGSTIADLQDLQKLFTQETVSLEGRLVGMYWDATPNRTRVALHGYAMDDLGSTDDNVRLLGIIKLMEALVTAPHGSVVDYAADGSPVFVETRPELDAYEAVVKKIGDAAMRGALSIIEGTHESGVTASDITPKTIWAAMMQVGHTPRVDEIETLSVINHVTSIDHEGNGRPLIAHAPINPTEVLIEELPEMYDTLMHRHWMQGSLRALENNADSRWIADETYRMNPMTSPRWVS
jgi:FMN phosphatase YigB (HAD superfamily)